MKYAKGVLAGAVAAVAGAKTVLASGGPFINTASAGNGGVATAAGNGGALSAGNINSGGNVGNAIGIGDTYGQYDPDVYGGDISNATSMDVAVDGGTGIADATGGNNNLAFVS
jgi:hypothetical protein